MPNLLYTLIRESMWWIGKLISLMILKIEVIGLENVPRNEPLILISNHFSWFDGPILMLTMPFRPIFLIATETTRIFLFRLITYFFKLIPIWRGRVDRKAMDAALGVLKTGGVVGVFPEGGIDPATAERRNRGEQITEIRNHIARPHPVLAEARSGVAFLALESNVRLLPVALLGTERIWSNLVRFRRTAVILRIGSPFGPLMLDPHLKGRDRRQAMDRLSEVTMHQIAQLFPPERRGPFEHVDLELL